MASDRISPTAHYTGYVWVHNGLSPPALGTPEGRLAYQALRPGNAAARLLRQPNLEGVLLARHRTIDWLLERAVAQDGIGQVIEIAAGLSGRGARFVRQFDGRIRYLEADLPAMAARKRRILADAGLARLDHQIVDFDALAESGPLSLSALAAQLAPDRGLAIVTEGLLNYFDEAAVRGLWARIAATLVRFPRGLYLSDLFLGEDSRGLRARLFARLLSRFVRGRVHVHFAGAAQAGAGLLAAGFTEATLHRPLDFERQLAGLDRASATRIRIVVARTAPAA